MNILSEEQLKHFSAGKHISDTQNINKSGIPHHEVFDFETAEIEPVDSDPTRIAAVSHSVPSYDGVHTGVNDSDLLDFESVPEKQADSLSDILSELSLLSYADEEGARSGNNSSKRKKHASFKASKKSPAVSLWQDFYAWFSSKLINKIISAVVLVAFTCGIVLCFSIPGKS